MKSMNQDSGSTLAAIKMLASVGLIAGLLFSSCNNSFGAFASIQKAQAQTTSSDFMQASVVNFAQTGEYYFAVMAAVYYRPVSGGSWSCLSLPGVGTNYACTGIASDGTKIYISATSNSDNSSNIYYSTNYGAPGSWNPFGINGISLTVNGNSSSGEFDQIDGIWLANGTLYAQKEFFSTSGVVQNPHVGYSLYYSLTSSSSFQPISAFSGYTPATAPGIGNTTPFMGVAAFNSSYNFLAYGTSIYAASSPYNSFSLASAWPGDGTTVLGIKAGINSTPDLFAWTATNIYVTTTTTGTSFASVGAPSLSSNNFISDVQEVPTSSAYELVVGTGTNNVSYSANGYFEGPENTGTPITVSSWSTGDGGVIAPNSISSTYDALFASKPVTKLYFASSQKMLFAGISASGLGTTAYGLVAAPYPWTGIWTAQ